MQNIYLFNPQNDLALATGGINYVAPPFALQMAQDLAVLPAFIAEPGSLLITDSDEDAQWLQWLNSTLGIAVRAIKRNDLRRLEGDYRVMPWGWCLDLRRRLVKWGARRDCLPSKDLIYHLRGLSHRRLSINIHLRLRELLQGSCSLSDCPLPVELAVPEEVEAWVNNHPHCYIKSPWSSSGRGIYHATGGWTAEMEQWCRGALKKQGSVLCEVALNKVIDFAVEFHVMGGKCRASGYSIFNTDAHSQYCHGLVAPATELHGRITALYPELDKVVAALSQVIDEMVAPHYTGWLGVDMMIYKEEVRGEKGGSKQQDTALRLNPCVELNLRPTMGAVTSRLGDMLLAPGITATFSIEQRSSNTEPWPRHPQPVIEGGHLTGGTLCLTTASNQALYRAIVSVNP